MCVCVCVCVYLKQAKLKESEKWQNFLIFKVVVFQMTSSDKSTYKF